MKKIVVSFFLFVFFVEATLFVRKITHEMEHQNYLTRRREHFCAMKWNYVIFFCHIVCGNVSNILSIGDHRTVQTLISYEFTRVLTVKIKSFYFVLNHARMGEQQMRNDRHWENTESGEHRFIDILTLIRTEMLITYLYITIWFSLAAMLTT